MKQKWSLLIGGEKVTLSISHRCMKHASGRHAGYRAKYVIYASITINYDKRRVVHAGKIQSVSAATSHRQFKVLQSWLFKHVLKILLFVCYHSTVQYLHRSADHRISYYSAANL
jgi:hypothetical protein